MKIDENNDKKKTKATDQISPEIAKKPRVITNKVSFVDMSDPLFAMTETEIRECLSTWFDACDPILQKQSYGWGYRPAVARNYVTRGTIVNCAAYYEDKKASILEEDKALFARLCDLHIVHTHNCT